MKKLITLFTLFLLSISLFACGKLQKQFAKEYTTKEVYDDLKNGLEARWDISDKNYSTYDEMEKYFTESVNAEYNTLKKYKTAKIKDTKTKKEIQQYIKILSLQKKELKKLQSYPAVSYYNYRVYNERRIDLLKTIVKNQKIKFDNEDQKTYNDLIKADPNNLITKKSKPISNALAVNEIKVSNSEDGYRTVRIKVQNLTDNTFDMISITGRSYDKDDTVLEETSFDAYNLKPFQTMWVETFIETKENPVKLTADNYSLSDKTGVQEYNTYEYQTPFSKIIEKSF